MRDIPLELGDIDMHPECAGKFFSSIVQTIICDH